METVAPALALPPSWYLDPDVLRLEQERIFAREWQYAGRADQVAEPGSYFACRAGDVPLVVVRDRDGELRAHRNVCRHRGAVIAEGEGRRETLQCAYHAWTYDLDGSLRAAPRLAQEGLDRDSLGLVAASVDTWGPFVFVHPEADAPPLADALGELPSILSRVLDVDSLVFHSRVEFHVEANWKIAVANFLECYHCPTAHRDFSRLVDVDTDAYVLETHPTFSSQYSRTRDGSHAGQFHLLWPNVGINVFPAPTNLSIGPILPAGPERTYRFLDYFFGPEVDERAIAELFELDDTVGREDAELVARVQRGAHGGVRGVLMPESERLIAHFDALVARALA